jgi:hypothetical protein
VVRRGDDASKTSSTSLRKVHYSYGWCLASVENGGARSSIQPAFLDPRAARGLVFRVELVSGVGLTYGRALVVSWLAAGGVSVGCWRLVSRRQDEPGSYGRR